MNVVILGLIKDKISRTIITTEASGQERALGLSFKTDFERAHDIELDIKSEDDKGTKLIAVIKS
jgi:hypothetical protein